MIIEKKVFMRKIIYFIFLFFISCNDLQDSSNLDNATLASEIKKIKTNNASIALAGSSISPSFSSLSFSENYESSDSSVIVGIDASDQVVNIEVVDGEGVSNAGNVDFLAYFDSSTGYAEINGDFYIFDRSSGDASLTEGVKKLVSAFQGDTAIKKYNESYYYVDEDNSSLLRFTSINDSTHETIYDEKGVTEFFVNKNGLVLFKSVINSAASVSWGYFFQDGEINYIEDVYSSSIFLSQDENKIFYVNSLTAGLALSTIEVSEDYIVESVDTFANQIAFDFPFNEYRQYCSYISQKSNHSGVFCYDENWDDRGYDKAQVYFFDKIKTKLDLGASVYFGSSYSCFMFTDNSSDCYGDTTPIDIRFKDEIVVAFWDDYIAISGMTWDYYFDETGYRTKIFNVMDYSLKEIVETDTIKISKMSFETDGDLIVQGTWLSNNEEFLKTISNNNNSWDSSADLVIGIENIEDIWEL